MDWFQLGLGIGVVLFGLWLASLRWRDPYLHLIKTTGISKEEEFQQHILHYLEIAKVSLKAELDRRENSSKVLIGRRNELVTKQAILETQLKPVGTDLADLRGTMANIAQEQKTLREKIKFLDDQTKRVQPKRKVNAQTEAS